MSSNKKSGSRFRWIQIIFIILGAAAIIIELAYIFKVIPQSAGSSNETSVVTQSTSEVKSDRTAVNNEDKDNNDNNINKYVFVGDSRYVGMSAYKEDTDTFIAKNNMGYSYLEEQMSLIKQSCDKNTALIIGLGVNDLKYSREKYITVKKQLTEKIEKIQSEQKALASVIIEEERYRSRIRTAVQQLEVQIERGKLTKEIIDTMIDTVYVYDKKRIEVILRFDDVLQKVISKYMEGAKGA